MKDGAQTRPVWAEVDLDAVADNLRALRAAAGEKAVMAVVKANAYGHGAVEVARAALWAGASHLGVATPEEGRALRRAGIAAPILVLGAFVPQQAPLLLEWRLTATIASLQAARELHAESVRQGQKARIHLKVDTGMGRLGVLPDEVRAVAEGIARLPRLECEGVYTHLATADEADLSFTMEQMRRFEQAVREARAAGLRPSLCHAGNSAALMRLKMPETNMVRVGISMYGLYPSRSVHWPVQLRPALSLKAQWISVKRVPKGTGVSYGLAYTTEKETNLGVLPIGYADGFSRLLSGRASILHRGKRYQVAGRICMDQCVVDLGDDEAESGEEVVLLGRQGDEEITVEEWADLMGTINYEALCMISERVPRLFVRRRS